MGKPSRGLRNNGAHRLNVHRTPPAEVAAGIHHALQHRKDRGRLTVAVLDNGDVSWGPRDRGIVAQVLRERSPDEHRRCRDGNILGTFDRRTPLEFIERRLVEQLRHPAALSKIGAP